MYYEFGLSASVFSSFVKMVWDIFLRIQNCLGLGVSLWVQLPACERMSWVVFYRAPGWVFCFFLFHFIVCSQVFSCFLFYTGLRLTVCWRQASAAAGERSLKPAVKLSSLSSWVDIGPSPSEYRVDIGPSEYWVDIGPSEYWVDIGPSEYWVEIGPSEYWVEIGPSEYWVEIG